FVVVGDQRFKINTVHMSFMSGFRVMTLLLSPKTAGTTMGRTSQPLLLQAVRESIRRFIEPAAGRLNAANLQSRFSRIVRIVFPDGMPDAIRRFASSRLSFAETVSRGPGRQCALNGT